MSLKYTPPRALQDWELTSIAVLLLFPEACDLEAMSNRRAPLSSIPNAANSPYRTVAAAASKRSRVEAGLQEDLIYDGQHPIKRQALETRTSSFRTPPQKQPLLAAGDGLFGKRSQTQKPTAFERKLLAAKDSHWKASGHGRNTTGGCFPRSFFISKAFQTMFGRDVQDRSGRLEQ